MFACLALPVRLAICFPLNSDIYEFGLPISFRSRHFCVLSSSLICLAAEAARQLLALMCLCLSLSRSLIKAHFSNATWHFQGCFLVVVGAIHQLCWPPANTTHQEICHAGRRIIKYFHLCSWRCMQIHQMHTLYIYVCVCVFFICLDRFMGRPKLAKPMHLK